MNNKNFVNFHILVSHSPSNLNRDDMGMQKTAVFGGVKRVRISSQSLKRAIRKSDYYKSHFEKEGELSESIRTRELKKLYEKMKEKLKYKAEEEWIIKKAIEILSGKEIKDVGKKTESDSSDKKESNNVAPAPWAISEIDFICKKIQAIYEQDITDKDLSKEKKKKGNNKKTDEELEDKIREQKVKEEIKSQKKRLKKVIGKTADIALSGRMTTSGIMQSVDGSLAVAHAITTYSADSEIDWFTAVDDLKQDEDSEGKGSAYLGTTEFSSGVFYRYASLNLKQLQKNLGEEDNKQKALKIASHVLHLLATVTPSAKQNSFAAHNLADFALVTFSNQPLSLANAFETPVKDRSKEGLLKPSVRKLLKYQKNIEKAYGLKEDQKGFYSIQHCYKHKNHKDKLKAHTENLLDCKTLEKLKAWVEKDAKAE